MERTKFGKKRNPLQYSRVLRIGAVEPAESFFLFAERDVNGGDHRRRDISFLPGLQKLRKNILCLCLPAHARVGDGKTATWELGCLLSFGVKRDRFCKVAFLPIRGGKIRIQVKVIWIELQRPLTLGNRIIDAIVSQVRSGGNVANDGRHWI